MSGWMELERFVLSGRGGAGPWFLFDRLLPPHHRGERWLRAVAARSPTVARRALRPAGPGARAAGEALELALGEAGVVGWSGWVLVRPQGDDRRGRLLAFLFPAAGGCPDRVVKLRPRRGPGRELAAEAAALERLGRELSAPLGATLPGVLARGAAPAAGWEVLVLSSLPGRSGYVELQGSLAPRRLIAGHFRAAGAWLAAFHRATLRRDASWPAPAWDELAPAGEPRPAWHRRLAAELAAAPWPQAEGHGDFWVRNLLLDPDAAGGGLPAVVDWEHHRQVAPPFEDLFHFAWTYALAYPWGGRRRERGEAFARAFLRDTVVSREVRRYLATYARDSGMDRGALGALFRVYLLQRARVEGDGWTRLYRMLEAAERSVFSG